MQKIVAQSTAFLIGAVIACSTFAQTSAESTNPGQIGRWVTESGNLEVDIARCGPALCGTVVRVIANRSMSNPNTVMAAADGSSPLGMKILKDFAPSGDGEWKGTIYNREDGETYDCLMTLLAPDQLKIRGYKGLPLFGKTQIWRRVSDRVAQ